MPSRTPVTPPEVELVRSFVDTVAHGEGTEVLESPAALERWLRSAGLAVPGMKASGRDLRLAVRLRDALRAELATHHGRARDAQAAAALEDVCRELPLTAVCTPDALAPATGGIRGALGKIVAAAAAARIKGSWARLKICSDDACRRAFYDTSRGRSKRRCSQ